MPVRLADFPKNQPLEVYSSLTLGTFGQDITPQNNRRRDVLHHH
jgi:hypothetical protein